MRSSLKSAKMYADTGDPGLAGVPRPETIRFTRFELKAFAFSTLTPGSYSSPNEGHPVSPTTTEMLS